MFSDGFVTHIGNLNLIAAAAWLPLVVLGMWRALRDLSWRWAILGGAAWGMAVLAGHAQIAYFTGLMIGGVGVWWIGYRLWRVVRRGGGVQPYTPTQARDEVRRALATFGVLVLILAIGLGLSAGSWSPALEMAAQTGRAGLSYEEAAKFSLPLRALIGLVAPWVYGRGPAGFTGTWDRVEVGYIGAVGLILSLAGAWVSIRQRSRLGIFLVVVGVLSFGVALGDHGPLHRLAYDLIPGFKNFRAPARFILLMNFAQALLAGIALSEVMRMVRGRTAVRPYARGVSGQPSTLEMVKQGMKSPSPLEGRGDVEQSETGVKVHLGAAIPAVILLLAAAELIGFGATAEIDRADPRSNFSHPDEIAWLEAQGNQPFRIDAAPAGHWQSDLASLATAHGAPLYDIYGVSNPLALASYEGWYWSVGSRGTPPYNFLGVRYVLAEGGPPADATFKPVASFPDGITIYQNTRALPLAMLVARAIVVGDAAKASDLAHQPDWDPRQVVYVENGPALTGDSTSGGSVAYTQYSGNRIALQVVSTGPAYLVFSEVYYPGWVATVDGEPATIYRANAAFRAVYIGQPGAHDVVMEFEPPLVTIGLAITGLSLLALIGVCVSTQIFHRRDAENAKRH